MSEGILMWHSLIVSDFLLNSLLNLFLYLLITVANAGALVTTIQDKVSTKSSSGDSGHIFLKMDAGKLDALETALVNDYGFNA